MFPLPEAPEEVVEKWQGVHLKGLEQLTGFYVVWCGVPANGRLTRHSVKPEHVFVLKRGETFKYAVHDNRGFQELQEKWYTKCFGRIDTIPNKNVVTISVKGIYLDLPFLPQSLYNRKVSTKKRKKTHRIAHGNTYPTWKHATGKSIHVTIAGQFKDLFDRADANEITLQDPFEGYASIDEIKKSKTGKMAFRTVAGFVYYHCRDNLGYPVDVKH